MPGRRVTLILLRAGEIVGALSPFPVRSPWWQDVAEVVDGAERRYGARVVVLRLLEGTAAPGERFGKGGHVTYLAELSAPLGRATRAALVPAPPTPSALDDQPLRMPWARPGGPAAAQRWAAETLDAAGRRQTGEPHQVRTWNLSGIWRLTTDAGPVWLKLVPPFLGHEGAVIEALGAGARRSPLPRLLGRDGGRMLLGHAAGDDQYEAPLALRLEMVRSLVALQASWAADARPAPATLPSLTSQQIASRAAAALAAQGRALTADKRRRLEQLIGGLESRFAQIAACGIPDSLVHGDFHAGNVRWDGSRLTILDWGDSGTGHPLLDLDGFVSRMPADGRPAVERAWVAAWREAIPGCDPASAARLLRPVAPLRSAGVYQHFLDGIEPAERGYHAADVGDQLRRAAAIAAADR